MGERTQHALSGVGGSSGGGGGGAVVVQVDGDADACAPPAALDLDTDAALSLDAALDSARDAALALSKASHAHFAATGAKNHTARTATPRRTEPRAAGSLDVAAPLTTKATSAAKLHQSPTPVMSDLQHDKLIDTSPQHLPLFTVKTKPLFGDAIPVLGVKPKWECYVLWLSFKIGLCSAISFKKSRRELSIDVAEHGSFLGNKGVVRILVIFQDR